MKRILTVLVLVLAVVVSRGSIVDPQSPAAEFVADELLIQFQPGTTAADRADARGWVGALRTELLRRNGNGELEVARIPAAPWRTLSHSCGAPRRPARRTQLDLRHQATSNDAITPRDCCGACTATTTVARANQFGSQAGEAWAAGNTGSRSVYRRRHRRGHRLQPPRPRPPTSGPTRSTRSTASTTTATATSTTSTAGTSSQNNNTIYDGAPGNDTWTARHARRRHDRRRRRQRRRRRRRQLERHAHLGEVPRTERRDLANAIKALDYLTDLKTRHGLNIVATNNSWGGGGFSQALLDAIIRGANAGILFVAAAGNGNAAGIGDQQRHARRTIPSNYNTHAARSRATTR